MSRRNALESRPHPGPNACSKRRPTFRSCRRLVPLKEGMGRSGAWEEKLLNEEEESVGRICLSAKIAYDYYKIAVCMRLVLKVFYYICGVLHPAV